MRSTIVKGRGSRLYGAKCRLCVRCVAVGEAVLYDQLPTHGYVESRYVMHVDCVQAAVDRAPRGVPATGVKAQHAAIRRRAIAISQGNAA